MTWRLPNTLRFKGFLGQSLATPATIFYWQQALFAASFYREIRTSSNNSGASKTALNDNTIRREIVVWKIDVYHKSLHPGQTSFLQWEKMLKTISLLAGRATVQEEQGQGREIPWVVGLTFQEKFMKLDSNMQWFFTLPVNIFQVVT